MLEHQTVSSYYLIPSYHFHIFWSSPTYHLITSYHPVTSFNQLVSRTARSTDDLEPERKKIKVEQRDLSTEAEVANLQQPWLEQTFGKWIVVITLKSMLHYWGVICLGFHKDIESLKANHHGCLTLSAWGWSLASTTAQRSLLVGTEVWCTWRAKESAPTLLTEKCNSIQTSLNPKQIQVNQGVGALHVPSKFNYSEPTSNHINHKLRFSFGPGEWREGSDSWIHLLYRNQKISEHIICFF